MPSLSDIHARICTGSLTDKARAYDVDVRFLIDMINDLKRQNQTVAVEESRLARLNRLEKALVSAGYIGPFGPATG